MLISHTIIPSRTRLPNLAHELPYLAHDFKVGLDGVFAVMAEKRREEHG